MGDDIKLNKLGVTNSEAYLYTTMVGFSSKMGIAELIRNSIEAMDYYPGELTDTCLNKKPQITIANTNNGIRDIFDEEAFLELEKSDGITLEGEFPELCEYTNAKWYCQNPVGMNEATLAEVTNYACNQSKNKNYKSKDGNKGIGFKAANIDNNPRGIIVVTKPEDEEYVYFSIIMQNKEGVAGRRILRNHHNYSYNDIGMIPEEFIKYSKKFPKYKAWTAVFLMGKEFDSNTVAAVELRHPTGSNNPNTFTVQYLHQQFWSVKYPIRTFIQRKAGKDKEGERNSVEFKSMLDLVKQEEEKGKQCKIFSVPVTHDGHELIFHYLWIGKEIGSNNNAYYVINNCSDVQGRPFSGLISYNEYFQTVQGAKGWNQIASAIGIPRKETEFAVFTEIPEGYAITNNDRTELIRKSDRENLNLEVFIDEIIKNMPDDYKKIIDRETAQPETDDFDEYKRQLLKEWKEYKEEDTDDQLGGTNPNGVTEDDPNATTEVKFTAGDKDKTGSGKGRRRTMFKRSTKYDILQDLTIHFIRDKEDFEEGEAFEKTICEYYFRGKSAKINTFCDLWEKIEKEIKQNLGGITYSDQLESEMRKKVFDYILCTMRSASEERWTDSDVQNAFSHQPIHAYIRTNKENIINEVVKRAKQVDKDREIDSIRNGENNHGE